MQRFTTTPNIYVWKVGPDYSIAHAYSPSDCVTLSEWRGRTFEEFDRGMKAKGYAEPDVNRYSLPHRGDFVEYTYNRVRVG